MKKNNNKDIPTIEGVASLGQRIGDVAILVGGKKILARRTSISESQLYRYISGQSQPTALPLAEIARAGSVDLNWLVTGQGNLIVRLPQKPGERYRAIFRDPDQLIEIPYYENEGGDNRPISKMGKFAFRADWLQESQLNLDALRLLHAYGDSMETTIHEGDLLMIDTSQTRSSGDAIFALSMDDHLIIKRLQHAIDGGVYISSDNPHYREQYVPADQLEKIKIVGRVVWVAGRL